MTNSVPKPFYKQTWFIIVGSIFGLLIILFIIGKSLPDKTKNELSNSIDSTKLNQENLLKANENKNTDWYRRHSKTKEFKDSVKKVEKINKIKENFINKSWYYDNSKLEYKFYSNNVLTINSHNLQNELAYNKYDIIFPDTILFLDNDNKIWDKLIFKIIKNNNIEFKSLYEKDKFVLYH